MVTTRAENDRRLIQAAFEGDLRLVTSCLAATVSASAKHIALDYAITKKHHSVLKKICELGLEKAAADAALLTAAQCDVTSVENLLQAGASLDAQDTFLQDSALHRAAAKGQHGILQLLLEKGMDIDLKNACNETSLMLAAQGGHLATALVLLVQNANHSARNSSLLSAKDLALRRGHQDVVRVLEDAHNYNAQLEDEHLRFQPGTSRPDALSKALFLMAGKGHRAAVEALLNAGAGRNDSALLCAAKYGHLSVVELLLDHSFSVNACGANSETPLILAAGRGHDAVCALLMERGADLSARNIAGSTAIDLAIQKGFLDVVRVLVNAIPSLPTAAAPLVSLWQAAAPPAGSFVFTAGGARHSSRANARRPAPQPASRGDYFPSPLRHAAAGRNLFERNLSSTHSNSQGSTSKLFYLALRMVLQSLWLGTCVFILASINFVGFPLAFAADVTASALRGIHWAITSSVAKIAAFEAARVTPMPVFHVAVAAVAGAEGTIAASDSPPASKSNEEQVQQENLCAICWQRPITSGFYHKKSQLSHRCACASCALEIKARKMACPICRRRVDGLVTAYHG